MPYVPSEKTDGKSQDRKIIDKEVEKVANEVASKIVKNSDVKIQYYRVFSALAGYLPELVKKNAVVNFIEGPIFNLAKAIYDVSTKYDYEGAHLGELNYTITRLIQRVPQIKVERGEWESELRYWLYAATVKALTRAAISLAEEDDETSGVFEDIKDEYKRRVNTAYEAAQILKSGDCYDTPYYTKLVEVVCEKGCHIGHMEVMLKRSPETVNVDLLKGKLMMRFGCDNCKKEKTGK